MPKTKKKKAKKKAKAGAKSAPPKPVRLVEEKRELVSVLISKDLARVLVEMKKDRQIPPSAVPAMIDEMFDVCVLQPLLLNNINPEQFGQAKTFEDRCDLTCAFLRAWQQEDGYCLDVKFGPFIVHVAGTDTPAKPSYEELMGEQPDMLDRKLAAKEK